MRLAAIILLLVFALAMPCVCTATTAPRGQVRSTKAPYRVAKLAPVDGFTWTFINDLGYIFCGRTMISPHGVKTSLLRFSPPVGSVWGVSNTKYFTGTLGDENTKSFTTVRDQFYVWNLKGVGKPLVMNDSEPGSTYQALSVNDSGLTAGWITKADDTSLPAASDANGNVRKLPMPDGYTNGAASDINDAGTIVGSVSGPNGSRAVTWDQAGSIHFWSSNDGDTYGISINDSGTVLGVEDNHYIIWDTGGQVVFRITDENVFAWDINDRGEVVAEADAADKVWLVVFTASGARIDLPNLPGYPAAFPTCINNQGIICGSVSSYYSRKSMAAIWTPN